MSLNSIPQIPLDLFVFHAACDQCRKLKCKCERTGSNIPCRNCVTLNAGQCIASVLSPSLVFTGSSRVHFLGAFAETWSPQRVH